VNNADQKFPDENFVLRHAGPGVLSCVNSGPDTNGSGFYISFIECEWMNDRHVVFGCVCNEESFAVLFELERQGSSSGKPKNQVLISDCGQLYP
jgi:cyclophilin family peptidyl-prolyl cis-trans isomerase